MDRFTNEDQQYISRLTRSLHKEYVDSVFKQISEDELPALRSETRRTAKQIYENWEKLGSIVQRHESTIQRRWTKKSILKRRELLLTTWPSMARDHRPDFVLVNKNNNLRAELKKATGEMLNGRPWQPKQHEGSQREALLMPYINLHDLTKTEPLLLMINGRARQPPHAFAKRDLQLSTHRIDLTEWRSLKGYVMDFDGRQSFPAVYGEFREGELKKFIIAMGADPRIAGGLVSPGDGLWVLEIQDRIYKFLLDIVQRILHDIPAGDLTGPKYSIQPEPPLPSANCRRDGVASLASSNLEAAYSAPGRVDLHRLQLLVEAKASEEEDKLWDFREDPGRFTEGLKEFIAHQPACVPDLSGTQKLATSTDECGTEPGSRTKTTEYVFGIKFLLSNFECVAFWSCLARDIASLVELKKKLFDNSKIELGDPLPEPFELALHKIQFFLCLGIDLRLTSLLREAHASPPIRPYFRRASPDTIDDFVPNPGKNPPRHISDFLLFLYRLSRDDCFTSIGHIAGVQSLLEQYDKFIHTDPDAHRAVSSYVAQDISYLSLLSECLRQTHLFEPWAATYHEESEILHVQDVLKSQFKDLEREIRPVETVNFSARLRCMPSAIAERPYPAYKKRTAANVDAMQSAETLLDQMWDALLAEMDQQNALNTHVGNVLFSQGRQLQRTPNYVEPVKPINGKAPQLATPDVLVQPFGELNMDETRKVQSSPREKTKIKTRGIAALQPPDAAQGQAAEQEDQRPAQTIQVDQRALNVFSTLFHTPSSTSQPGDVPWNEFLHAMRSAGFGMESLQGSAWQFTPHDDTGSGIGPGKRSILFHEPHPTHRIPFWDARRHGRRLARAYGWSGETFVAN